MVATQHRKEVLEDHEEVPITITWDDGPADTILLRIAQGFPSYDPQRTTLHDTTERVDSGWKTTPRTFTLTRGGQQRTVEWERAVAAQALPSERHRDVALGDHEEVTVAIEWAEGPPDTILLRIAQGFPSYDPQRTTLDATTQVEDSGWKTTPRHWTLTRGEQERTLAWAAVVAPAAPPPERIPEGLSMRDAQGVIGLQGDERQRVYAQWPDGHFDRFILRIRDGVPTYDVEERSRRTGSGQMLTDGVRTLTLFHQGAPRQEVSWRNTEEPEVQAFVRVAGPAVALYREAWAAFEVSDDAFGESTSNNLFFALNHMVEGSHALSLDQTHQSLAPALADSLFALCAAVQDHKHHHLWHEYGTNNNNTALPLVNHMRYCIGRETNHRTPKGESKRFAQAKVDRLLELHRFLDTLRGSFQTTVMGARQTALRLMAEEEPDGSTADGVAQLKQRIDAFAYALDSTLAAIARRANLILDLIDYWEREGFYYHD